MQKFWCGVVSREHILRGVTGGFCQVCHGKRAPLDRMKVGDGIVFYSPTEQFKGKQRCQRFTAIGQIVGGHTYAVEMFPGFVPFRKDVNYFRSEETPLLPLLPALNFTRGQSNWGAPFRFGHFALDADDFLLIAQQMLPMQWQQHFPQLAALAQAHTPRQIATPAAAAMVQQELF